MNPFDSGQPQQQQSGPRGFGQNLLSALPMLLTGPAGFGATLAGLSLNDQRLGRAEQLRETRSVGMQAFQEAVARTGNPQVAFSEFMRQPEFMDLFANDPDGLAQIHKMVTTSEGVGMPRIEEVREGLEQVTYERDPATAARREIGRGPAFAPQRPLVEINTGEDRETSFATELGKVDAERFSTRLEGADRARASLPELDRMDTAIAAGRFTTGAFGNQRAFLSQVAELFGASPEDIGFGLGAPETADTLEAASAGLAVIAAQEMGRNTNMALSLVKDSFPALTRTPEGNRIIIEFGRRHARRAQQVADLSERYIAEHGTVRPGGGVPSLERAISQLDEIDPIVDDALRERILQAKASAPKKREAGAIRFGAEESGAAALAPVLPEEKTYVNPETGERIRWDSETGAWVPVVEVVPQ